MKLLLAVGITTLLLAGCGNPPPTPTSGKDVQNEPPDSRQRLMPTATPAALGQVRAIATVLEADGGPQLCLGGVAESLPPQCGGPLITNWQWAKTGGAFEETAGVRWGEFVVTGTFDGSTLTQTEDPIPLALYDAAAEPPEDQPTTPCSEPDGGWRVLDSTLTTEESMQRTLSRAARLDGYAGAWLDQSMNPAADDPVSEEWEGAMNDPRLLILNIQVTGDSAETERILRETWGGMLCVSRAEHTEAELLAIQTQLTDLPGMLSAGASHDHVEVGVVYDDGSLQAWVDAAYGEGLVTVSSALQPLQ